MIIFKPSVRATYRSFHDYRARRRAVRALLAMEDVFLKDIGVGRSEIHSVVQGLVRDR
jgi:uncharacterized protein YjiS (DUF1127 family)